MIHCPLCKALGPHLYDQDKLRSYYECRNCSLVFVSRDELITPDQEFKRYETHNNSDNEAYRAYLSKIVVAVSPHVEKGAHGLDFGCGSSKLLEELLEKENLQVDSFDLFFHPDQNLLTQNYDFLILSEVIEHLRELKPELLRLSRLLNDGGAFFIKTKLLPEKEKFGNWFYKRDPTHVQFFKMDSFKEVSKILGTMPAEEIGQDLFLFRKR